MILFRKVIRDLRQNAVQFLAIFITTLLSLLFVGGFNVSDVGVALSATEYLTETNYKDMNIQGAVFTPAQVLSLSQTEGVKAVNGVLHAEGKTTLDRERLLAISYIDGNEVSKMKLMEGEPYERGAKGAWVEDIFARAMGLRPGDVLSITSDNQTFQVQIRGLVYAPEYLYYVPNSTYPEPEYGTHGFVIMDISEAPGGTVLFDEMIIDLEDVHGQVLTLTEKEIGTMNRMRSKIAEKMDNPELLIETKTEDAMYDIYTTEMNSSAALSTVFPALFMAVALLGILSTMTRITSAQRTQIGTMKALGFSTRTITLHYLCYPTFVAALACVFGVFIGKYTLGVYLNEMDAYYYQNPLLREQLSVRSLLMSLLAIGMCVLTTFVSARGLLVQNASEILRPEAPKGGTRGAWESMRFWETLKFATRWNIRDVAKNRLRTVMSLFGILLCSALLFSAVSFYESLGSQSDWMYNELVRIRYQMVFQEGTSYGTVYDYAYEYAGQMIQEEKADIIIGDLEMINPLTIVGEGSLFRVQDERYDYMEIPPEGVLIGMRLMDAYDIRVGDSVTFRLPGNRQTWRTKIVGVCRIATEQGLIMSREAWERIGGVFAPSILYTNKTLPDTLKTRPGVESVNSVEALKQALENSHEVGYTATYIIIIMAIVTGVTVLYNLGVLSYLEKVREIATLKVLGFQSKSIRFILLQQNLTLTAVGALLGIPLGAWTVNTLIAAFIGEDGDLRVEMTLLAYLIAVGGTFLVSVAVNLLVTRQVNHVDMVEALKGVE